MAVRLAIAHLGPLVPERFWPLLGGGTLDQHILQHIAAFVGCEAAWLSPLAPDPAAPVGLLTRLLLGDAAAAGESDPSVSAASFSTPAPAASWASALWSTLEKETFDRRTMMQEVQVMICDMYEQPEAYQVQSDGLYRDSMEFHCQDH